MGIIVAITAIVAVMALILAVVALSRLGKFISGNEQRAYVQNVLHAVEVRGELDRQERNR